MQLQLLFLHLHSVKTVLLIASFLLFSSCFILVITDGDRVVVGNHEDWFAKDAAVKVIPATETTYGSVIFTFASEGWAQGGMNSEGLFFDGALTPLMELSDDDKPVHDEYIWQHILNSSATVGEALDLLTNFHLPDLEEAHIMLADATGDAAILGIKDGKPFVSRRNGQWLMQTNFNPEHPELSDEPGCWRYETANDMLIENQEPTVENMLEILKETHQDDLTVYTNIYDLTGKRIFVYSRRDFLHPITIDILRVLEGSAKMVLIEDLKNDPAILDPR